MQTHDTKSATLDNATFAPMSLDENFITSAPTNRIQRIVQLQQTIGNQAVQRLVAEGKLDMFSPTRTPQPTIQRQCGCGCATCNGVHEEVEQTTENTIAQAKIQREEDDDNDGGNWLSDTFSTITEAVGGWFGGNDNEEDGLKNIPKVTAKCESEEAIGHGNGGGREINLHGVTTADFNEGEPMPDPFPDTVEVETFDAGGGRQGFNAHGTFDVTFDARTNVTLPDVPDGLTPCQTQAVQAFIEGPLTDHENDHVSAFRDNYDGTATLRVDVDRILDTPANRRNSMQNPLATEHNTRRQAAVNASNALDPWNQDIPGLDCEDE